MLYGAFHRIEPVLPRPGRRSSATSSDRSARAATRSAGIAASAASRSATSVAIRDAGAYGAVMASNYNRRPMPAEVLVDGRHRWHSHPAPADDRRPARPGSVMPGHAHRLRGPRSEREADPGRAAARPPRVARPRMPDRCRFRTTRHPSGPRSAQALHGEREYAPDVMQLLYVANRYEYRARIAGWLADGVILFCDRYRRLEHRVRRSAGPRSGVAVGHPAVPAAAGS